MRTPVVPATATAATSQEVVTSWRAEAGLGIISGHLGAEAERWFSDWFGGGVYGTAFGVSLKSEERAYGGGIHMALRTFARGNTPWLTLGGGIAQVSHTNRPSWGACPLLWDEGGGDESEDDCAVHTHEGVGAYFGAGLGWLFHPNFPNDGLELGPVLRLDIANEVPAITLNFALGRACVL